MIRITADIDTKNKVKIAYYIMKILILIKNIKLIEIRKSYSKGYHFIIWTTYKYNQKEVYLLRKKIGDDWNRIRLDQKRKIGRNTLFYTKIKSPYKMEGIKK